MNNKITINMGYTPRTFFLQNGFYERDTGISPLHKHYYTEIHMVLNGKIYYYIGKKIYSVESGGILSVPPNMLHACNSIDCSAKHCSLLVDFPTKSILETRISPPTLTDFFAEINKVQTTNNYSKISGYLSLIYHSVFESETLSAVKIEDYSFIIEEFLKTNYSRDIKLTDLAAELNLSEKHTERLVKKYTGNTFKQELASIRIETAQALITSTDMPMTEISEYVGYKSYSGFYKAYKKNIN